MENTPDTTPADILKGTPAIGLEEPSGGAVVNNGEKVEKVRRDTNKGDDIVPDDFVVKVLDDPEDSDGISVFIGFIGRAAKGKGRHIRYRLYFTLNLQEYVEFDLSDVAYAKHLAGDAAHMGNWILWFKKDALLRFSNPRLQQAAALQGNITSNLLSQLAPFGFFPAAQLGGLNNAAGSGQGCTTLPLCAE